MKKAISKLDYLVTKGLLIAYDLVQLSAENVPNVESKFGNHEQLILLFPNQETLVIDCCCSGISENLTLNCQ